MLKRYWAAYPDEREEAPEETADRIMVFQRGAEAVSKAGRGMSPSCPDSIAKLAPMGGSEKIPRSRCI